MKNMTPLLMAEATGGMLTGPEELQNREVSAVITDSRKTESGCLFAAIRGERSDGHAFIPQAVKAGAGAVLAEHLPEGPVPVVPVILVKDTLTALKDLAAWYLDQVRIPTVGIIGSAGKTSTKEMTAAVLNRKYRVLKTEGNFNNELGVPLTVFRIRDEHQIAVIEMGINHFGEMRRLARIVRPDTVVMTNIGTAHLEFLESREGILKAKSEVFEYLRPDGCVILNGDDDMLVTIREVQGKTPVFYGIENRDASVRAENIDNSGIESVRCRLILPSGETDLTIPGSGIHAVSNALAGAAVGYRYGLTKEEIAAGVAAYQSLPGRFHVLHLDSLTVIDDSYNANPSSVRGSLDILRNGKGRRVAILGDMGELGTQSPELHKDVGRYAAEGGIDILCCVGERSREMAAGASEGQCREMQVHWFEDRDELIRMLPELIRKDDTVLVKASRAMGFEKIVGALREKQETL